MYAKLALALTLLGASTSVLAAPVELSTRATTYSGDMTYYTPGLGSCGETNGPNDHIVALSKDLMKNGANPNNNPLCNKMIDIHFGGKTFSAKVVDTCQGCSLESIDVTPGLFTEIDGSLTAGRLHNVQWNFA